MEQFPWTESGLELLLKFETMVDKYGGPEKLIEDVEYEWTKKPISKYMFWSRKNLEYVKQNYFVITQREIAANLNLSTGAISQMVLKLHKKGELPYMRRIDNLKQFKKYGH